MNDDGSADDGLGADEGDDGVYNQPQTSANSDQPSISRVATHVSQKKTRYINEEPGMSLTLNPNLRHPLRIRLDIPQIPSMPLLVLRGAVGLAVRVKVRTGGGAAVGVVAELAIGGGDLKKKRGWEGEGCGGVWWGGIGDKMGAEKRGRGMRISRRGGYE